MATNLKTAWLQWVLQKVHLPPDDCHLLTDILPGAHTAHTWLSLQTSRPRFNGISLKTNLHNIGFECSREMCANAALRCLQKQLHFHHHTHITLNKGYNRERDYQITEMERILMKWRVHSSDPRDEDNYTSMKQQDNKRKAASTRLHMFWAKLRHAQLLKIFDNKRTKQRLFHFY